MEQSVPKRWHFKKMEQSVPKRWHFKKMEQTECSETLAF
jgi:hypothetical protein